MMTNARYVIRNNYSGAYVYKTLFRIRTFPTRFAAIQFMRFNGINEKCYEIIKLK